MNFRARARMGTMEEHGAVAFSPVLVLSLLVQYSRIMRKAMRVLDLALRSFLDASDSIDRLCLCCMCEIIQWDLCILSWLISLQTHDVRHNAHVHWPLAEHSEPGTAAPQFSPSAAVVEEEHSRRALPVLHS